jgi:LPS-assembly protein
MKMDRRKTSKSSCQIDKKKSAQFDLSSSILMEKPQQKNLTHSIHQMFSEHFEVPKFYPSGTAAVLTGIFASGLLVITNLNAAELHNGWLCEPMAGGKWNCAADTTGFTPANTKSQPAFTAAKKTTAATVASKPSFPEPDFSDPNTGPTGGRAVIKPVLKSNQPVLADNWSSCAVQPAPQMDRDAMAAQGDESTNIEADSALSPSSDQINFSGNVIITKNVQTLTAEQARYNKTSSLFEAEGNVVITEPGMILEGDKARYQSETRKGRLENATYQLPSRPAQGIAENIRFKPGKIDLANPTYSTCPAGDEDWQLSANEIELHTEEGYGEGKHVVMKFKGVPIGYTPYINFPLNDERKSGFLMPRIGSSDGNGFELSTPYYFNIAPDQDATITPRLMSDRGLMLGGQYRYLSENHSGEIYGEWLNDSSYDDEREASEVNYREGTSNTVGIDVEPNDISKNRGAFSMQQRANWSNGWSGLVDYNYVSDNYYLDDFGNNLRDKSETSLKRDATLRYNGSNYNFMTRVQGYQGLTATTHTYSRLPQMTFSANQTYSPYGIDIATGFDSEFVMFAQNWDDPVKQDGERVEAKRLHFRPRISAPFSNSYSFVTPKLSLDMVTYKLDNEDVDSSNNGNWDDDNPSRIEPVFSLDSGLFFDREFTLFGNAMQQSLEPRLFYLYVPEDDQSDIPVFDSGQYTFTFNQLFRENRFSGRDRLGDANQLTAAVTSRFIKDDTGSELLSASIGQIYYFEDREVTLNYDRNGNPVQSRKDTDSSSSIAGEIRSRFAPNWYTSYSLLYDPHDGGSTEESRYRLQYKSDRYHIANLDYSYVADDYEQVELSAYWKLTSNWRALAHWYYSLYDAQANQQPDDARDGYTLDTKLGVEYDSCCYAIRLIAGREQDDYYSDSENYIMMELQFKGLGSIAQSTGGISSNDLADDIPGFEPWNNLIP